MHGPAGVEPDGLAVVAGDEHRPAADTRGRRLRHADRGGRRVRRDGRERLGGRADGGGQPAPEQGRCEAEPRQDGREGGAAFDGGAHAVASAAAGRRLDRLGGRLPWHRRGVRTPLYDDLLGEVLQDARVARDRLAAARTGLDRLHVPDADAQCGVCREAWPCATRQLVDGLARGELDDVRAAALVDAAVAAPVEAPVRPAPPVPRLIDLLDRGRTGRALDLLLGGAVGRR